MSERPVPKFTVGQVVVINSLKKQPPFRISAIEWNDGWFYAWNRKNYAAESMIRALNDSDIGRETAKEETHGKNHE